MGMPILEIEGTGPEIAARLSTFVDRRLHVVVSDAEPVTTDRRRALLQQVHERTATMNPKPSTRDYIREGRAGPMYGYEPSE